jgi:type II secretory pathway component GspD/PulD (secretin)
MNARLACAAVTSLILTGFAVAQPQKPESKGGGEQKHAVTPADVERRLAELENSVAAMLKEVRALRDQTKSLAGANPKADDVRIFSLKHADAASMAKMLKQLLQGPDAKNLSIAVDERTNSVVVRGGGEHLEVIEAIISRLEEKSAKAGKTDEKPRAKETDKAKAVLSDLDEFKSRFKNLDIDVEKLQERAEWLKRMGQKGFLGATEIELDMKKLESARDEILKAREQLLKQFEKSKQPDEAEKKPKK